MSGDSGGSTTTVQNNVPAYIEQGGKYAFDQAKAATQKPAQTYQGVRVASFSPTEVKAKNKMEANTDASNYSGAANAQAKRMGIMDSTFTGANVDKYMNPYEDAVVGALQKDMARQRAQDMMGAEDAAIKSGAFNPSMGSGEAILKAETDRNYQDAMARNVAGIRRQGFMDAAGIYGADMDRAAKVANDATTADVAVNDAQARRIQELKRLGLDERSIAQSKMDTAYNDWTYLRDKPYQDAQFLGSLINGIPYSQSQMSSQQTTANPWMTAMGIGTAALGTAGALGWQPFSA